MFSDICNSFAIMNTTSLILKGAIHILLKIYWYRFPTHVSRSVQSTVKLFFQNTVANIHWESKFWISHSCWQKVKVNSGTKYAQRFTINNFPFYSWKMYLSLLITYICYKYSSVVSMRLIFKHETSSMKETQKCYCTWVLPGGIYKYTYIHSFI